jgi:alpha-ketoglutaric semialdehyde dehydrogenase
VRTLAPADPGSAGVAVGPVITDSARQRVIAAATAARDAGGRVLTGGQAPERDGWFVDPTVVEGVALDHPVMQEETFGPLAAIHRVATAEEAIAVANGVRFGLVTSLHGHDIGELLRGVAAIDTGMIKVNAPTSGVDFYAPFGGEKDSSFGGREQGRAALDFYTTTHTVTVVPAGR